MFMNKHKKINIKLAVFLLIFAVCLASLLVFYTNHRNKINHKQPISIGQTTKGEPKNTSTGSPTADSQSTDSKISNEPSGSTQLLAPSGNFVSNHRPNLDGNPAPNLIQSVCVTSVGASCYISFSNGQVTKSLNPQTTDAEGATYWSWKLQDIGITTGNWKITAIASYGSSTKTTVDPLSLEVGP